MLYIHLMLSLQRLGHRTSNSREALGLDLSTQRMHRGRAEHAQSRHSIQKSDLPHNFGQKVVRNGLPL